MVLLTDCYYGGQGGGYGPQEVIDMVGVVMYMVGKVMDMVGEMKAIVREVVDMVGEVMDMFRG